LITILDISILFGNSNKETRKLAISFGSIYFDVSKVTQVAFSNILDLKPQTLTPITLFFVHLNSS
jgi:hypothetical protein